MRRATRRVASHAHSSVCHRLRLLLSASELRMMKKRTRGGKKGSGRRKEGETVGGGAGAGKG